MCPPFLFALVRRPSYPEAMNDQDVANLLSASAQARRAGNDAQAVAHYEAVLAAMPQHPAALNGLGLIALDAGDFERASTCLRQAAKADPTAPELWLNLAKVYRLAGDAEGEAEGLDQALAIDQRNLMANIRRAELHEKLGEVGSAMYRWSGVLSLAENMAGTNAELDRILARGRAYLDNFSRGMEDSLSRRLGPALESADSLTARRFDACLGATLGKRRIYNNECHGLHYPFLPADEYFDAGHFPWLATLEAATTIIRQEFLDLMAGGGDGLQPYVQQEPGTPANKWSPLDNSPDWSAWFFWKHGVRQEDACARCPKTAALLDGLPLSDIPGRSPSAFFSLLRPGAHIPPHTGVTNARAIVHLPLVVPPGCTFRVGGETRTWEEGRAFAFDDTIEHEAWNRSDQLRAVLIFDVWNPHLTELERQLLRELFQEMIDRGVDSGRAIDD